MGGDLLLPLLFAGVLLYGLWRQVDVFAAFTDGAEKGLAAAVGVLPALVALVTAVGLLEASGGLELLTRLLAPLAGAIGLPGEVVPLVLGAPGVRQRGDGCFLLAARFCRPRQLAGRVGSVIFGATETVFYTVALYLGSGLPRDSRRCALAGLARHRRSGGGQRVHLPAAARRIGTGLYSCRLNMI